MADDTVVQETGNENENSNEKSEDKVSVEEFKALKAELDKQNELISKLRTHEKTSLTREEEAKRAAEAEREKRKGIEGEFDAFKAEVGKTFNGLAINAALENALIKANVHNVDTALKLVGTDGIEVNNGKANLEQINERINSLRETDAYLFKQESTDEGDTKPPANSVKRSGERKSNNTYAEAIGKITNIRDLEKFVNNNN